MNIDRIGEISYVPELLGDKPRLLIVGATSSGAASLFLQRYPNGRAAICEPDPVTFAALRAMPRLSLLNVAVGNWDGIAPFYRVPGRPDAGSLQPPPGRENLTTITVRVRELGRVLGSLGWARAELLALDAEGAESTILYGCFPETVQQISVEFHENWKYYTADVRERITEALRQRGYDVASGANGFYSLFYPAPAKETSK